MGILFRKVVNTMYAFQNDYGFYRVSLMTEYGQRHSADYALKERQNMLEWVKLLLAQEDTAYVDVKLISDSGNLLKWKMLEGKAYERFIDSYVASL